MQNAESNVEFISVKKAFSKQSVSYDRMDKQNLVLQDMRNQVYQHVLKQIKNNSHLLELNAGTGIDALYFANKGYSVHATDLSDGMIIQLQKKISEYNLTGRLSCEQLSYDQLITLSGRKFDYIFSNFGGLNCIHDLYKVTVNFPRILNPNAYVTWVIMPPVCLWEIKWLLNGKFKHALRRFYRNGVLAHLEGEYFKTYYHSLSQIKKAFGKDFKFIRSEGLCALSPPPASVNFQLDHPKLYQLLRKADALARHTFPFNRWADHIIVTFQYQPS